MDYWSSLKESPQNSVNEFPAAQSIGYYTLNICHF